MTVQTNTPQGQLAAVIKELRQHVAGLLKERDAFAAKTTSLEAQLAALQAKYDALIELAQK